MSNRILERLKDRLNTGIVDRSSDEQTKTILELLPELKGVYSSFTIYDIFMILPDDVTIDGRRGYLTLTTRDLSYVSYDADHKYVLIHSSIFYPNKNVFDGMIDMIRFLKKHQDK